MNFLLRVLLEQAGPEIVLGVLEALAAAGKLNAVETAALKTGLALEPLLASKTAGWITFEPDNKTQSAVQLVHVAP